MTFRLCCLELQAAYKESQARIVTFEKLLRERTPLTSIDDVDDFGNYLNTLSMRTNVHSLLTFGSQKMSLEELKRVTEANDSKDLNYERLTFRFKEGNGQSAKKTSAGQLVSRNHNQPTSYKTFPIRGGNCSKTSGQLE